MSDGCSYSRSTLYLFSVHSGWSRKARRSGVLHWHLTGCFTHYLRPVSKTGVLQGPSRCSFSCSLLCSLLKYLQALFWLPPCSPSLSSLDPSSLLTRASISLLLSVYWTFCCISAIYNLAVWLSSLVCMTLNTFSLLWYSAFYTWPPVSRLLFSSSALNPLTCLQWFLSHCPFLSFSLPPSLILSRISGVPHPVILSPGLLFLISPVDSSISPYIIILLIWLLVHCNY